MRHQPAVSGQEPQDGRQTLQGTAEGAGGRHGDKVLLKGQVTRWDGMAWWHGTESRTEGHGRRG